MNVLVDSLNATVGFTVASTYAHRDSCSTPSACCAAAADEQAAEPENHRPFALGDALAGLVAVALSAGNHQTGNRNRVAAKRISMVLALEEQSRAVRSTLRQRGNTRANPADEYGESTMGSTTDSLQSSRCRRWVGCTIATSEEPPDKLILPILPSSQGNGVDDPRSGRCPPDYRLKFCGVKL